MIKKRDRVNIIPGIFSDKDGKQITTLEDAMEKQAKCCGIDCCRNVIVLDDQEDGLKYEMGFVSGVLSTRLAHSEDAWVAV